MIEKKFEKNFLSAFQLCAVGAPVPFLVVRP
jgi:hypothetical protein